MLTTLHRKKGIQLLAGLAIGFGFGFLLQKGNVTEYDVIVGQLLFRDFTVVKIMVSAICVSMIGVYWLRSLGLAQLHPKPGSLGSSLAGGIVFGIGFGLLGYCPGTIAAAVAQGKMDALAGGMVGILLGAGLYAHAFPFLERTMNRRGEFGSVTFPDLYKRTPWLMIVPLAAALIALLIFLERSGL